ncbi:10210_t:CDS:2, partial [Paraglomus occultum]
MGLTPLSTSCFESGTSYLTQSNGFPVKAVAATPILRPSQNNWG